MSKLAITLGSLAAPVMIIGTAWADSTGSNGYGGHMWGGWHGWTFGPVMMFVSLAVIIAIVMLLVRWLRPGAPTPRSNATPVTSPMDILRQRFAKGEIDQNEFDARRKVLEG